MAGRLAQESAEHPAELWGFCKTCPHAQRCRAGCAWTSHVLFGRPGNNPFCHSRALAQAEAGIVEKLEPGEPLRPASRSTSGATGSWEAPLGPDLEADPLIGMMMASHAFGLAPGSSGLWSKADLAAALAHRP